MNDQDYEARLAAQRAEWLEKQAAEKILREQRKVKLIAKHAEERAVRELEALEKKQQQQQLSELFSALLRNVISEHVHTLKKKYAQTLSRGDYGQLVGVDQWLKEIDIFCKEVINNNAEIAEVRTKALRLGFEEFFDITQWLPSLIDAAVSSNDIIDQATNIEEMSGEEFEIHCSEVLRNSGWSVFRKGGTGDQGVDLIGLLGKLKVAIQCKRYLQPVGNKAVQEVAAGRQFEQCDLAAVVSNAAYTPAARKLASAVGVMLLHYSELSSLREQVEKLFPLLVSGEVKG